MGTGVKSVARFVQLLDYQRLSGRHPLSQPNTIEFSWFSSSNFESLTGVYLTLTKPPKGGPLVHTRTTAGRSYHDLLHQNRTIREIQLRFGGTFETDEGRNRVFSTKGAKPEPPPARGAYVAHNRFQRSIGQVLIFRSSVAVPPERKQISGIHWLDSLNPSIIANNLLLPFLTSALEDFFKSTFVALLRYSDRKDVFLKASRLNASQLSKISDGKLTVEEAIAETLPFQRISSICDHYRALDPKLDLSGCLKKPYRRRRTTLFESLESMVEKRHELIHRNCLSVDYSDANAQSDINNLRAAVQRSFERMIVHYGWKSSLVHLL